jgi:aryl-alcohol dehydrogenase-like predicted oxidoreductase
MDLRRLGDSGLKVSEIGLGCNNFGVRIDQGATTAVVATALDAGITFFDTADVYGEQRSEVFLGVALAGRRHGVILATKFGNATGPTPYQRGASRRHIVEAAEASLKRLHTDYIDLYQLHRPDADTPIEETLAALDDLVRSGKVRYIGNSNFSGWSIADADWIARNGRLTRFVSAQNNYSMLRREAEAEVIPASERFGLGLLPFFPLASGLLTGKYRRNEPPPPGTRLAAGGRRTDEALTEANFDRVEALRAYAQARGHTLLELAFAWLLARPVVSSVIAGATRPEQVQANAAAASWRLTPEEFAEVNQLAALAQ